MALSIEAEATLLQFEHKKEFQSTGKTLKIQEINCSWNICSMIEDQKTGWTLPL